MFSFDDLSLLRCAGDGFDMGYLHGVLSAGTGDAFKVCTTYLHHIVLNLLDEEWDQDMAATCEGWAPGTGDRTLNGVSCELYETLLSGLETWLIAASETSFLREKHKFPAELISEMEGFAAGAVSEDPGCGCTMSKILYLNYGIDVLMSSLYTGQLPRILASSASALPSGSPAPHLLAQLAQLDGSKVFKVPFFCNSFGASGAATASGTNVYMTRDFQLTTGEPSCYLDFSIRVATNLN